MGGEKFTGLWMPQLAPLFGALDQLATALRAFVVRRSSFVESTDAGHGA
ncbi:hypothetical protein [Streptomyces sp. CA-253872]